MERCSKATVNVLFLFWDMHKTWDPLAVAVSVWRWPQTIAVNAATLLRPVAASYQPDTAWRGGDVLGTEALPWSPGEKDPSVSACAARCRHEEGNVVRLSHCSLTPLAAQPIAAPLHKAAFSGDMHRFTWHTTTPAARERLGVSSEPIWFRFHHAHHSKFFIKLNIINELDNITE